LVSPEGGLITVLARAIPDQATHGRANLARISEAFALSQAASLVDATTPNGTVYD
jgi:hypothetical protein